MLFIIIIKNMITIFNFLKYYVKYNFENKIYNFFILIYFNFEKTILSILVNYLCKNSINYI